jgi:hypothetical protein
MLRRFLVVFLKIKNIIFLGAGPFSWGGRGRSPTIFLSGLMDLAKLNQGHATILTLGMFLLYREMQTTLSPGMYFARSEYTRHLTKLNAA